MGFLQATTKQAMPMRAFVTMPARKAMVVIATKKSGSAWLCKASSEPEEMWVRWISAVQVRWSWTQTESKPSASVSLATLTIDSGEARGPELGTLFPKVILFLAGE